MNRYFFIKNGFECDFVTMTSTGDVMDVIQVCIDMSKFSTRKREVKGLVKACGKLGLDRGIIVSFDEQDKFTAEGINIIVTPLVHFLCDSLAT